MVLHIPVRRPEHGRLCRSCVGKLEFRADIKHDDVAPESYSGDRCTAYGPHTPDTLWELGGKWVLK